VAKGIAPGGGLEGGGGNLGVAAEQGVADNFAWCANAGHGRRGVGLGRGVDGRDWVDGEQSDGVVVDGVGDGRTGGGGHVGWREGAGDEAIGSCGRGKKGSSRGRGLCEAHGTAGAGKLIGPQQMLQELAGPAPW